MSESTDHKIWAIVAHSGAWLANLSGGLLGAIVPMSIYLGFKDSDAFVADHAKESLNFRLTLLIAHLVNWILFFSMVFTCVALPMFLVLWAVELIFTIAASLAASAGNTYRHPICIRLVK